MPQIMYVLNFWIILLFSQVKQGMNQHQNLKNQTLSKVVHYNTMNDFDELALVV